MRPDELGAAARVAAAALATTPLEHAIAGADARHRQRALERLLPTFLSLMPDAPLVARVAGDLVGVASAARPGACRLGLGPALRYLGAVLHGGPRTARRRLVWMLAAGARDPARPHWHVGPVAVAPAWQRRGIGSRLLAVACARFDARGEPAWLETDQPGSVALYERFGFGVADAATVLGLRTWFLWREPRTPGCGPAPVAGSGASPATTD